MRTDKLTDSVLYNKDSTESR